MDIDKDTRHDKDLNNGIIQCNHMRQCQLINHVSDIEFNQHNSKHRISEKPLTMKMKQKQTQFIKLNQSLTHIPKWKISKKVEIFS